jgi:hypothetical protein
MIKENVGVCNTPKTQVESVSNGLLVLFIEISTGGCSL